MPRIVIDIDENMYQQIKGMENLILKNPTFKSLELAVLEGKVLPEHHGRLIDADVLVDGMEDDYEFCEAVNATPTIIPATKEGD